MKNNVEKIASVKGVRETMARQPVSVDHYSRLVERIKNEISTGQKVIRHQQAVTYWKVGRYIHRYVLQGKGRAGYGDHLYERLEEALHISADTLKRTVQFFREFPIRAPGPELSWSHYRNLLRIKDESKRKFIQQKVIHEGLSKKELAEQIKKEKVKESGPSNSQQNKPSDSSIPQLPVRCGRLFTYRIIAPQSKNLPPNSLRVDCGFNIRRPLSAQQAKNFKKDDIVESSANGEDFSLTSSRADKKGLFTYKAFLEKVVDGDTACFEIDCGFNLRARQNLRFNSIDCSEISTPQGRKAKRFVENELKKCEFVIVKTYSHDKYDRYLADIFYLSGEQDVHKVAQEGQLLNQKLLDVGLAQVWRLGKGQQAHYA